MQQFLGRAVSPGYAKGTAFLHRQRQQPPSPRYEIDDADVPGELARFHEAVERSLRELKQLERRLKAELGEAESAIFAAHYGLLQDVGFADRIKNRVRRDLVNVEHAVDVEVADLCRMLSTLESEFIRERADDIRDAGMRIMRQLSARDTGHYVELPPRSVIVARELLPSETLDLDREHVAAIVTEEGGENSHAAILARAMGIPAVTGIASATSSIPTGAPVLVDGEKGVVCVKPSLTAMHDFSLHKSSYDQDTSAAAAAAGLECVTRDGIRISLLANLNRPQESALVEAHHLDGVGLFRTEFMFLDSAEPPSFERQVAAYRQVIEAVSPRPVVVRTLDLGGDKLPAFLTPREDAKAAVAARGLRFSLAEHTLLETQIRAVLAAAEGRPGVRLLLPMVLGAGDLSEAVELARQTCSKSRFSGKLEVGAMLETPAALFALEEICELADFVCLGTNDLTQYMLAADRDTTELAEDYSVLHPGVLRAIAQVVQAGRSAGREVSVCGEAASYPRTACLLAGLGVRQLSMSPRRAARVRYLLREMHLSQLERLAEQALASRSAADVRHLLEQLPASKRRAGSQP